MSSQSMNSKEKLQKAMEYAVANRPKVGGFPFLAECLRKAGIKHNTWSLPAAQSVYMMEDGWIVNQGTPLVTGMVAVPKFDQDALIKAIRTDQAGESTFPEFLKTSWNAGVVGYDVDFDKRTVTYMGMNGEQYVEEYPAVEVPELKFL